MSSSCARQRRGLCRAALRLPAGRDAGGADAGRRPRVFLDKHRVAAGSSVAGAAVTALGKSLVAVPIVSTGALESLERAHLGSAPNSLLLEWWAAVEIHRGGGSIKDISPIVFDGGIGADEGAILDRMPDSVDEATHACLRRVWVNGPLGEDAQPPERRSVRWIVSQVFSYVPTRLWVVPGEQSDEQLDGSGQDVEMRCAAALTRLCEVAWRISAMPATRRDQARSAPGTANGEGSGVEDAAVDDMLTGVRPSRMRSVDRSTLRKGARPRRSRWRASSRTSGNLRRSF